LKKLLKNGREKKKNVLNKSRDGKIKRKKNEFMIFENEWSRKMEFKKK
jgi:hypothetical protein